MYIVSLLTYLSFLLHLVSSKSIYIDNSCKVKDDWEEYWKETKNYAKQAKRRIEDKNDGNFAAIYTRIFPTTKNSDDDKYVKDTLKSLAELTEVNQLKHADIRVFCDNDERWQPRVSSRGGFRDLINGLVTNTPRCKLEGIQTVGFLYSLQIPYLPPEPLADQPPDRVVLTLCNLLFTPARNSEGKETPLRLTDALKQELSLKQVWELQNMVSMTIFHELAHAVSIIPGASKTKIADLPDQEHAYGWDDVINKKAPVAVLNAQNYAYLGLWGVLAELGYTLTRVDYSGLSKEDKEALEFNAHHGFMVPIERGRT